MAHECVVPSCYFPPFFDETNYAAWSEKFQIFLEAQELNVVDYLTFEWKAPSKVVDGEYVMKLKEDWTPVEVTSAMENKKARNTIVTAISPTQFAHNQYCSNAKQV